MKCKFWILAVLFCAASCSNGPDVQFFSASNYPATLSAWGVIDTTQGQVSLPDDAHIYDLNSALFTDFALKLRTVSIPPGSQATYSEYEAFDLPVGSIISKTFFYRTNADGALILDANWNGDPSTISLGNTRLIETRLLVRQAEGWDALPYIWKGNDAYLAITGDLISLPTDTDSDLNYLIPSKNQCGGCHATNHTTGAIEPIGIKARHLNKLDPVHGNNQLRTWQQLGQLKGLPDLSEVPANASFTDDTHSLDHRARSYLDINCGHCHNPQGAADTSGLLLDYQPHSSAALGLCKPPIAAGRGSGGHLYSIVPGDSENSILTFRMGTTDPGTMMPELGRSLVHQEGLDVINSWIDQMQGVCR